MFPTQRNTQFFALIAPFVTLIGLIVLTGFSMGGCSNSDDDDDVVTIDEPAAPLVVKTSCSYPIRSDATYLADRMLYDESDDLLFDTDQRKARIREIKRLLSLIRAAYPAMTDIRARQDINPDRLVIRLEPQLYEKVKNLIKDQEGEVTFETGDADFDALNAKLGLRGVKWGSSSVLTRGFLFCFDDRLNVPAAGKAYSMLEGVRRTGFDHPVGDSPDIAASKVEKTWYFIFRDAWGDCPAGCRLY
jgi:hypothetical protein